MVGVVEVAEVFGGVPKNWGVSCFNDCIILHWKNKDLFGTNVKIFELLIGMIVFKVLFY